MLLGMTGSLEAARQAEQARVQAEEADEGEDDPSAKRRRTADDVAALAPGPGSEVCLGTHAACPQRPCGTYPLPAWAHSAAVIGPVADWAVQQDAARQPGHLCICS